MISGSGFIPLIFHWMGGGTASHIYSSAPIYMVTFFARGCLFGWAASRFFVEGRRGGELELLLTTPVGAKAVVSSQWKELKRLFAWPVIIMVVCANVPRVISLIPYYARNEMNGEWEIFVWLVVNQALSCLESILGVGALIWTGLWFGLRARSQAAALVQIVLVSQAAPYVGSIAGHLLMTLLASAGIPFLYSGGAGAYGSWQRDLSLCEVLLPSIAVLLYYVWLIRWARRRLAGDLRDDSPVGFSLAGLRAGLNSFVDRARNWPPAPER